LYLLGFLEDLRDKKNIPTPFIEHILSNYHIVAFPVMNPWGLDETTPYARVRGRHPIHGMDLDSDYDEVYFNSLEARYTRPVYDNPDTIANMDLHLYRKTQKDTDMIYGIGAATHNPIINEVADITERTFPEKRVGIWRSIKTWRIGRIRSYVARHHNKHTPQTIAMKIELARPSNESEENGGELRPNSPEELYKMGYLGLYLYLQGVNEYYQENKGKGTYKEYTNNINDMVTTIEEPDRTIELKRYSDGEIHNTVETYHSGKYKGKQIRTTFERFDEGRVKNIVREIDE